MKTAIFFLSTFLVTVGQSQASAPDVATTARPTATIVEVGFPATRCKSLRMTETQRRHCDKGTRKAASKA